MNRLKILIPPFVFLLLSWTLPALAQSQNSRRPPELIRDTDTAEGKEKVAEAKTKEPDPLLAEQSMNIGNYYFRQKNYIAAIQRYLEAIEYQPNSIPAYEALAKAYEKNGDILKSISTYKSFIDKYPDSPKSSEFRSRLAKLEKKPG